MSYAFKCNTFFYMGDGLIPWNYKINVAKIFVVWNSNKIAFTSCRYIDSSPFLLVAILLVTQGKICTYSSLNIDREFALGPKLIGGGFLCVPNFSYNVNAIFFFDDYFLHV